MHLILNEIIAICKLIEHLPMRDESIIKFITWNLSLEFPVLFFIDCIVSVSIYLSETYSYNAYNALTTLIKISDVTFISPQNSFDLIFH